MKTGGRKKGTPNKKTLPLLARAKALKVDPFEILLLFAMGKWKRLGYKENVLTPENRLKAASEACQYLHPKRKALEVSDGNDPNEDRPLEDLSDEELDQL